MATQQMPSTGVQDLTKHLLELDVSGFEKATRSRFLEKAGKGILSKEVLQQWLSQDRLYAQAYIRFASLLLANIPLPVFIKPNHINERYVHVFFSSPRFAPTFFAPPSHAPQMHPRLIFFPTLYLKRPFIFYIYSQLT